MKEILIGFLILTTQVVNGQNKFEFNLIIGVGYDFQTRSNDYNLTGPLYIPAQNDNSILHIEKPFQYTLKTSYRLNENFGLLMNLGTTNRALRYWSLDSQIEKYTFQNDKIDLGIKTFHFEPGIRFQSKLSEKLNIFWDQTFGVGFGKSSPRFDLDKDHPQAELIYLQDQQVGALVNVNIENPIISINSSIGMNYKLFKNTFLVFGLKYINEVSNGNDLIIWEYNLLENRKTGAYNPYDMEFKSIFTEFGITYRL